MGAVDDHYSGTASGINNALTRIANVFANAIFGTLAVLFFSAALQNEVKSLPLNSAEKQLVMAQAGNLGNAKVPEHMNPAKHKLLTKAYHDSFIHAYAKIMQISAGLGFLASLMSVLFIKNTKPARQQKTGID